jgi:integrase
MVDHLSLKKLCRIPQKNDKDRIISNADMIDLIYTLHEKQEQGKYYIQNYAIELATLTGMRVGEIAALKWESITDESIKIDFSEHRIDYADKSCEYYIGEPKNGKHREFPLSDELKDLFKRIKAVQKKHGIVNEYVFADKNGRVNSHTISCAMNRRCEDAGIDKKSIHAIRRTVSSHLRTSLPIATVCAMLGHTEETNTKHYSYDVESVENKLKSLKDMYNNFQDKDIDVA